MPRRVSTDTHTHHAHVPRLRRCVCMNICCSLLLCLSFISPVSTHLTQARLQGIIEADEMNDENSKNDLNSRQSRHHQCVWCVHKFSFLSFHRSFVTFLIRGPELSRLQCKVSFDKNLFRNFGVRHSRPWNFSFRHSIDSRRCHWFIWCVETWERIHWHIGWQAVPVGFRLSHISFNHVTNDRVHDLMDYFRQNALTTRPSGLKFFEYRELYHANCTNWMESELF